MRNLLKQTRAPSEPASGARSLERLDCPQATDCAMFELLRLAGALKTWQIRYCGGDYHVCSRYQRAALGKPVPQNLMPNGQLLRFSGSFKKQP